MRYKSVLIANTQLGRRSRLGVAKAISSALEKSGWQICFTSLEAAEFDRKQFIEAARRSACVVLCTDRIDETSLTEGALSVAATEARQNGVPCHAIVVRNMLDDFGLRQLDLQHVYESSPAKLAQAASKLGATLAAEFRLTKTA